MAMCVSVLLIAFLLVFFKKKYEAALAAFSIGIFTYFVNFFLFFFVPVLAPFMADGMRDYNVGPGLDIG